MSVNKRIGDNTVCELGNPKPRKEDTERDTERETEREGTEGRGGGGGGGLFNDKLVMNAIHY